jgi:hypothetical protein
MPAHSDAMAASIITKIEQIQLRMPDGFFKTIQMGHIHRICALEANSNRNPEILREVRQHSERSDDDLRRLAQLSGSRAVVPNVCGHLEALRFSPGG